MMNEEEHVEYMKEQLFCFRNHYHVPTQSEYEDPAYTRKREEW